MADLSKLSDDELLKIAGGQDKPKASSARQLSDEDLVRIASGGEDRPKAPISPSAAAVSGFAQGATAGFSDEIIGGLKAGVSKISGDKRPISEAYKAHRDEQRAYIDRAKAESPGSFMAGSLAGTAVPAFALPALAPVAGAGLAANLARAAGGGALLGAGLSEKSPDDKEFLADVGKGAATGAAFQGLASGVGKVAGKLSPESLRKFAEAQAKKGPAKDASIASIAGYAMGGEPGALAAYMWRQHGSKINAKGAQQLASILEKAPAKLGAFAPILDQAAKAGPKSLMATHAVLMKDPDYSRILRVENESGGFDVPKRAQQAPSFGGQ